MAEPSENRHDWIAIAVGRVCRKCQLAQRTGEFDDSVPCVKR